MQGSDENANLKSALIATSHHSKESDAYPGLSANLGCTGAALTVEISLDGVVEEESVLIEVILGLDLRHSNGLGEGLARRLHKISNVIERTIKDRASTFSPKRQQSVIII